MKPGEKILAFIFLIFSIVILFLSYGISGFKSMSSPGSFPMIVSVVLLISAIFIVRDVLRKNKDSREEKQESTANTLKLLFPHTVIIFIFVSFLYVFLLQKITFLYATILYIIFLGVYFNNKKFKFDLKEIFKIGAISLATTIIVYFIFQKIFNVMLP